MSASPEKKNQSKAERNEKRRREEQKDRRSTAIYTAVAVMVVVAAAALMVWNSGLLQRSLTALEVNGTKYSIADVQYYYSSLYNEQAQQYQFNSTVSVKKQVYDETTGQSWHDHLMDLAVESLTNSTALAAKARSEGFTLTGESQSQLDSFLSQLNTAWIGQTTSREALIRANYGPYMTYDRLAELVGQKLLASDYAQAKLDAIDHPDADYNAYYKEHADELDTFTMTQFVFRATVPDEETDAEGNTIERTEEEEAQLLEQAKQDCKADADAVYAALEAGEDPQTLADQYETYSFVQDDVRLGSSVNSAYQEWAYDSARKPGDLHQAEYDGGTSYSYYVVRFEDRQRDETPSADVRHILVGAAESNVSPTEEQFAEAKTKAEELLAQWKAGEATEDSFAALAQENSADTGSATNGGMISGITPYSGYVETFSDWALDPARKVGDTGIVQNTGSSVQGWHIMYLAAQGDPYWMMEAQSVLSKEAQESWLTERTDSVSAVDGSGLKYV